MPLSPGSRLDDQFYNQSLAALWSALAPLSLTHSLGSLPTLELRETQDHFFVTATLPGMDLQKVQIQATPHSLTLWGEQQIQPPTLQGYSCSSQQFHQTISLPAAVQDSQVQVAFQADTLVITLPKAKRWSLQRGSLRQAVPTLGSWTLIDEIRHQGSRLGLGWRHLKHWFGRQLRQWSDWLLAD